MSKRPVIAVTMGDPAGIGPEVVVKALAEPDARAVCAPLVVGSVRILEGMARKLGAPVRFRRVKGLVSLPADTVGVVEPDGVDPGNFAVGQVSAACGRAAIACILRAVELVQHGEARAMATAPIHKEAMRLAGYEELGHQELLARVTGARDLATMLVSGKLRAVHLTTHRSLRNACDAVTRGNILAKLGLTDRCLRAWGVPRPRIAVAALNPHGGEGGLVGREEVDEIAPAVQDARARGIEARGPFPADSVFLRAIAGEFDAVLAMYHDQGHIPVKVHGFERSISVTLGLPFIRTSVDHGTAFDIAGKGVAQHVSMVEAIRAAAALATGRDLGKTGASASGIRPGHLAGES
ncbi:MAG: 4-hydroxythreonine-4-phosphate dehydrogenase PdxA [Dehalococcoidia bacterium]|nr:4-hydroxythreonine-4-phosphate dehydrogenase PdxA [Dehalococcoidia bacterium]